MSPQKLWTRHWLGGVPWYKLNDLIRQGSYGHFLLLLFRSSWRLFWLVLCFFWVYKRWTRLLFSHFPVMTPFFVKIYNLFPFPLFCYLIQWLFLFFQFPPLFSRSCNAYFSATKPFHRISLAVTISFQFLVSYNYTHEVFLGLVTLFQGNCFLFNFKKCFSWQNNSSSIFTFEIVPLKFLSSDLNYFLFIFQELKG